MIKNAMDASRAWSLTVFSYSDRGRDRDIAMVKEGIPSQSRRGCLAHAVGLAHTNRTVTQVMGDFLEHHLPQSYGHVKHRSGIGRGFHSHNTGHITQ